MFWFTEPSSGQISKHGTGAFSEFSEPKHVAEFLILITNMGCVIERIYYCVIAKHNGMAPVKVS
jgi:hypothetical protein